MFQQSCSAISLWVVVLPGYCWLLGLLPDWDAWAHWGMWVMACHAPHQGGGRKGSHAEEAGQGIAKSWGHNMCLWKASKPPPSTSFLGPAFFDLCLQKVLHVHQSTTSGSTCPSCSVFRIPSGQRSWTIALMPSIYCCERGLGKRWHQGLEGSGFGTSQTVTLQRQKNTHSKKNLCLFLMLAHNSQKGHKGSKPCVSVYVGFLSLEVSASLAELLARLKLGWVHAHKACGKRRVLRTKWSTYKGAMQDWNKLI